MTNTPKLEEMLKLYSKKELWDRIQEKNKIIEELDHKIEILEKALKLTCGEELREFGVYADDYGYEEQFKQLEKQYKAEAEKELKGE